MARGSSGGPERRPPGPHYEEVGLREGVTESAGRGSRLGAADDAPACSLLGGWGLLLEPGHCEAAGGWIPLGRRVISEIRHPRLPAKSRLHLRPQPGGREPQPSNGGLRRSVKIDGEKLLFKPARRRQHSEEVERAGIVKPR